MPIFGCEWFPSCFCQNYSWGKWNKKSAKGSVINIKMAGKFSYSSHGGEHPLQTLSSIMYSGQLCTYCETRLSQDPGNLRGRWGLEQNPEGPVLWDELTTFSLPLLIFIFNSRTKRLRRAFPVLANIVQALDGTVHWTSKISLSRIPRRKTFARQSTLGKFSFVLFIFFPLACCFMDNYRKGQQRGNSSHIGMQNLMKSTFFLPV